MPIGPPSVSTMMLCISIKEITSASIKIIFRTGARSGIVMRNKVCAPFAPSSFALSYTSVEIPVRPAIKYTM